MIVYKLLPYWPIIVLAFIPWGDIGRRIRNFQLEYYGTIVQACACIATLVLIFHELANPW